MAYLKPQAPLMNGADYVYPLTTSDQVVTSDGNRLSAVGVYLKYPDESESTEVTGVNVETFGGMTYQQFVDFIYPKGRVIMTFEGEDPNESYPWQTWERTAEGRFLLGAGDGYVAGTTGGEATHTLTVDEMPNHRHVLPGYTFNWGSDGGNVNIANAVAQGGATSGNRLYTDQGSWNYTGFTGESQPHNNMPPWIAAYMWKRTA